MAIDLVGPKGWEHNWVAVRPPATLAGAIRKTASKSGRASMMRGMSEHAPMGGKMPTGKASETTAGRRELLRRGHALPPASPGGRPGYPIGDAKHWDKAFAAVGRSGGGARREALRKLLIRTAPEFGKSGKIKGSWLDTSRSKNMANGHQRQVLLAADDSNSDRHAHYHTHANGSAPHSHAGFSSDATGDRYGADSADGRYTNDSSSVPRAPGALRTPANTGLRSSSGMNPGQIGLSNIDLARPAVTSMGDVLVSRDGGRAVIRHRRGGSMIGTMYKNPAGQWVSSFGDGETAKELNPHTHQRAALAELIGTHNQAAGTPYHRPAAPSQPLIPRPVQSPLMQRFGIPAATTLATPMAGSSDGPRVTKAGSDGDSDDGPGGLSPKGITIYKRLKAKGFPAARALAFARRAQNMGGK
jgi:hypothetical protein